jgi:hypothetical protein
MAPYPVLAVPRPSEAEGRPDRRTGSGGIDAISVNLDAVERARGLIAAAEAKHPIEQAPDEGGAR